VLSWCCVPVSSFPNDYLDIQYRMHGQRAVVELALMRSWNGPLVCCTAAQQFSLFDLGLHLV
jgi:hypothetical protein